jgi:hypothetical protein
MARPTTELGKRTKCTGLELLPGKMARLTQEALSTISVKARVPSFGLTADATSEDGELVSKMEKAPTLTRKTRLAEESGKMGAKFNGLTVVPLAVMIEWMDSDRCIFMFIRFKIYINCLEIIIVNQSLNCLSKCLFFTLTPPLAGVNLVLLREEVLLI